MGYPDYDYYYMNHLSTDVLGRLIDNGIARIACAEERGQVVATILIVSRGRRAYAVVGGQSPRGYEVGAGDLLFDHVMRQLDEEGVESLNLGGNPAAGEEGLRFYKSSLGATPRTSTASRTITPRARMVRTIGHICRKAHEYLR